MFAKALPDFEKAYSINPNDANIKGKTLRILPFTGGMATHKSIDTNKDGKIDDAYAQVKDFKDKNKVNVLTSDAMILYAELALKKQTKRLILDASNELEIAINSSKIISFAILLIINYIKKAPD